MTRIITLLIIPFILISCLEFRTTDEDAKEEFEETGAIQFGDVLVGNRNIHFAYTNENRETLIVFIHGSPGSWNAFIDYFKADSLLNYVDILSIDRPGFGMSDFGTAEPSMEVQACQMKAVIDLFDHEKIILVGHSLGGPVIARMAMDYPNAFDALIMVAPSIDPALEEEEWYRGLIATSFGEVMTPKAFEVSNDEIIRLKKELNIMIPLWDRINIPTIVIHGTEDGFVPFENTDFAKRMLADSVVEIRKIENQGHFILWDNPSEIIKAIQDILDGFCVNYP